jgi:putative phosphoribosyl transferase
VIYEVKPQNESLHHPLIVRNRGLITMEHIAEQTVQVAGGRDIFLEGNLSVPSDAKGIVLFAHGSGSSRHSPRNQFVARTLNNAGLATLLIDLLTPDEEAIDQRTRELRFDIGLLAERLVCAIEWLTKQNETRALNIGLFGASTGAGAALLAAALRASLVSAVVSRGGRPDLAGVVLSQVQAPTLLSVGEADQEVIELNKQSTRELQNIHRLELVPGATHLFEEPGALEEVARLAQEWFIKFLVKANE